ncbi:RNA polymerase subunit sigma-70 [Acrocarpospora corrugata]|uniref:RNA polymerase subunit sigma-70 n=1 Tax=Acrocarpospora corrugata TaxID=35763 RepID=UPI001FE613F2|nr:RNA polymerase subunit sigma-70 [Acrocarpospora corrugata]
MDVTDVTAAQMAGTDERLAAALAGDQWAFAGLVGPYRAGLLVHCYRMLGSLQEAEEALQETLLRAWRSLATYQGRAPLSHWLHKIATTACLKAAARRERLPATLAEVGHLQPFPDNLLEPLDPAQVAQAREGVQLAFIAALQLLPATQRAVLILREVLCWSAAEVAGYLGTSVPAINSMLQRARATLGAAGPIEPGPPPAAERAIVARFMDCWQRRDIDALAALLREDAILRMPPEAVEIIGRAAVVSFFATEPADGRLDLIELVPVAANRQPALAAYLPEPTGLCRGYGIMVLTITPTGIAEITGFPSPDLFDRFGLPEHRPSGEILTRR